jgi:antitoxin CptB
MDDVLDRRRKRLIFRSCHRGSKETDLLLGSFAERCLARMSEAELAEYERLIEEDDGLLYGWITGRLAVPPEWDGEVMRLLKAFKYTARPA